MPPRSRLEWVQRNRTRRVRAAPAAAAISRLAGRLAGADRGESDRLVEVIGPCVDDTFRRVCRVWVRDDRTISIQVGEGGLVYAMRQRWLTTVAEAVSRGVTGGARRRIVFAHGELGRGFGTRPGE